MDTSHPLSATRRPLPDRATSSAKPLPWRAPAWFEHRPLLLTGAISGAVVALAGVTSLLGGWAGIEPVAQRVLVTLLLAATAVVLLFRWRAWRATGFAGPRCWRDTLVAIPVLAVVLWPLAFGIDGAIAALALAVLFELPNSFAEEALFRGIVVRSFAGRRAWVAAVVSGVGFGFLHLVLFFFGQPAETVVPTVVLGTLFGITYGALRIRTGTIWAPMVLHVANNALVDFGRGLDVLGEGPSTLVLLVSAVVLPAYGLFLVRGRTA